MKFYTRWIHSVVQALRLEVVFIVLGKVSPFFLRFVPLPEEYPRRSPIRIYRDGTHFEIDRSDYMQWHLYAGFREVSWRKAALVLKPDSIVLDVGANCGQFCLKLASAMIEQTDRFMIHAFEPNPEIGKLLSKNITLNRKLIGKVQYHALALGAEPGSTSFVFSPANSGGGSVSLNPVSGQNAYKIKMDSMDNVVSALSLSSVDFVKIDVEGFEPEVLLGGRKTIQKFRPWIHMEITPEWFQPRGHSTEQIVQLLLGWNYELFAERNQEFVPYLNNEQLFRSLHQFNLLAKPTDLV